MAETEKQLNPRELVQKKKAEQKAAEEANYTFAPTLDRGPKAPVVASKLHNDTNASKQGHKSKVDTQDHANITDANRKVASHPSTKPIDDNSHILSKTKASKEAGWHGSHSQLSEETEKLVMDPLLITEKLHSGPQNVDPKFTKITTASKASQYVTPEERAKAEKLEEEAIHANAKKTTHTDEHVMKTNNVTKARHVDKYTKAPGHAGEEGWVDISRVHDPKKGAIPDIDLSEEVKKTNQQEAKSKPVENSVEEPLMEPSQEEKPKTEEAVDDPPKGPFEEENPMGPSAEEEIPVSPPAPPVAEEPAENAEKPTEDTEEPTEES